MGFIADIFTADKAADAQKDASRDAAKASQYATDKTIGLQKEIFDKIWGGTQVQRDYGNAATAMMAQIMGLSLPTTSPSGQPQTLPGQPQTSASASLNGGKDGMGPMLARMNPGGFDQTDLTRSDPTDFRNTFGGGGLTSGRTGQTQIIPGNALGSGPVQSSAPTQPFDVTSWLRSTPGYEANFKEGARALNTSLASRGKLFAGDAGREMTRYGQEHADRIFGDQWNRLAGIAGAGQTATSQGGQAGQNYANQSGNALQNNAANLGSSYANRGNAISGFWGSVNGSVNNAGNAFSKMFGGF